MTHTGHPSAAVGDARIGEVLAGVINDGSAAAVAAAAVRIARELRARVRFIQVLPDTLTAEARAEAEAALFSITLRALHGRPRVQATFESPTGDPARVLVARSRTAIRLVVGADQAHLDHEGTVAAYCLSHAACPVQIVTAGEEAGPMVPDGGARFA